MLPPRTYYVDEYTEVRTLPNNPRQALQDSLPQLSSGRNAHGLPIASLLRSRARSGQRERYRCRPPKPETTGQTEYKEKRPKPIEVQIDNTVKKNGVGAAIG